MAPDEVTNARLEMLLQSVERMNRTLEGDAGKPGLLVELAVLRERLEAHIERYDVRTNDIKTRLEGHEARIELLRGDMRLLDHGVQTKLQEQLAVLRGQIVSDVVARLNPIEADIRGIKDNMRLLEKQLEQVREAQEDHLDPKNPQHRTLAAYISADPKKAILEMIGIGMLVFFVLIVLWEAGVFERIFSLFR